MRLLSRFTWLFGLAALLAGVLTGCAAPSFGPAQIEGSIAWEKMILSIGEFPSYLRALAIKPGDETVWYGGTNDGKLYVTRDGGAQWSIVAEIPSGGPIRVIGTDSARPAQLFVGSDDGLYQSADGGQTLLKLRDLDGRRIYSFAQDTVDQAVLYAGTDNGVYMSRDGGGTWRQSSRGLNEIVWTLFVDPAGRVFAGTGFGLLERVDDDTWIGMSDRLSGATVRQIEAVPGENELLIGTDSGLLLRLDLERRSVVDLELPVKTPVVAIDVPTGDPSTALVGTDGAGIYRLDLAAREWEKVESPARRIFFLRGLDSHADSVLVSALESGVVVGSSGGTSWILRNKGLETALIQAFAYDPKRQRLYAGTDAGLYVSGDSGKSWAPVSDDFRRAFINKLKIYPSEPDTLYYMSDQALSALDLDSGQTRQIWREDFVTDFDVDPTDPRRIVGTTNGRAYYTTDGGAQWLVSSAELLPSSIYSVRIDPSDPRRAYIGSRQGLYVSRDGGATWEKQRSIPDTFVTVLAFPDPERPELMLLGTESGIYRSEDHGTSWAKVESGLLEGTWIYSFSLGSSEGSIFGLGADTVVYAATNKGVLWSADEGATWNLGSGADTLLREASLFGLYVVDEPGADLVFASSSQRPPMIDLTNRCLQSRNLSNAVANVQYTWYSGELVIYSHSFTIDPEGLSTLCTGDLSDFPAAATYSMVGSSDQPILIRTVESNAVDSFSTWRGTSTLTVRTWWERNAWWMLSLGALVVATGGLVYHSRITRPTRIARARQSDTEVWLRQIETRLRHAGAVNPAELRDIPAHSVGYALKIYQERNADLDLVTTDDGGLALRRLSRIRQIDLAWQRAEAAIRAGDFGAFTGHSDELVQQLAEFAALQVTSRESQREIRISAVDASLLLQSLNVERQLVVMHPASTELNQTVLEDIEAVLGRSVQMTRSPVLVLLSGDQGAAEPQRIVDQQLNRLHGYNIAIVTHDLLRQFATSRHPEQALRRVILRHLNLVSVSPFNVRGPAAETMFFGREPELQRITQQIGSRAFSVIGGRRIGKTSLLMRLHRGRLVAAGYRTLYCDWSTTPTAGAFLERSIRDWQPDEPSAAPRTFGELLRQPPTDRPLVLLLDEADKLVPPDRANGWALFNTLRGLVNAGVLHVVFSGERTLREAQRDSASPLFNFANELLLGPLDLRAASELVTRPMEQLEIDIEDPEAITRQIYEFTSGHPNIIQLLCGRLIARLDAQERRRLTRADVQAVIEEPKFLEDDFLRTYWESATLLERIITIALAQEPGTYHLQEVRALLTERHRIEPSLEAVKGALDRLTDLRSILKHEADGYSFAVAAFPLVLSRTATVKDLLAVFLEQYETTEQPA